MSHVHENLDSQHQPGNTRMLVAQVAAYFTGLGIVVPLEVRRFVDETNGGARPLAWFDGINIDTTLPLVLLLIAPLAWIVRRRVRSDRIPAVSAPTGPAGLPVNRGTTHGSDTRRALLLALLVGAVSWTTSLFVASYTVGAPPVRFGDLPPAYHDEYSYLFQAKTFLAGRLSFPSHATAPQLFDQMHVLNEGRFASRYFPGNGLWMTPFFAAGVVYWGHWLAAAMASMFVFAAGRELGGNATGRHGRFETAFGGLLAGLLTAVSPAMALFSNLLLAHQPTLAGLMLFLWMFLRMQRTGSWGNAFAAGVGLTFAMLCRPMTAAGFALPFGVWMARELLKAEFGKRNSEMLEAKGQEPRAKGQNLPSALCPLPSAIPAFRSRRCAVALAAPLVAGLVALAFYNHAITGEFLKTPYQIYTDTYTPRHVYGFNNVVRGERHLGPRVLENYDRWAENLTPALAATNVRNRMLASWQWTLGIVPLVMSAVVFLVAGAGGDRRWWFVPAAIVSLHAVHVPYWYDGILHWHYVFETAPLWLLLVAAATRVLLRNWQATSRRWMPAWWGSLIAAALLVSWVALPPFWPKSRVEAGVNQIAFARWKHFNFEQMLARAVTDRPALVLVEADPRDRHIDYVINDPDLMGDVLIGRFRPGQTNVEKIAQLFPERAVYLYRAADNRLLIRKPPN